ncbi:type II secretion system F family protein [Gluconacetobacter tumulisoli]|uniref:Type II secretion system F family protein n=1 Tax=Gluconacetobacter tumulisoli TaxID=1286189 RepID=A0A7W4K6X1_9PROT|nr:type II secretion system F family protein [Gluconacetobacter tumulisoli]MBB2201451.1 type II secretion system F family protein [Gluconacetobacter tumulisoli]
MSRRWRYTALADDGQLRHGVMLGEDEAGIVAGLRRAGLHPVRVARPGWGLAAGWPAITLSRRQGGLSRREVTDITRELALMLAAGQDLDRALRFLVETVPRPKARALLVGLREGMRGGGAFAAALDTRPESFSPLYVGLVRAGEAGGALAGTLDRIATFMERERSLSASIQSALIYPIILVLASIASIVLLLTQVLPQFVPLFEEAGAQLPLATRIVIAMGDFLQHWGMALLAVLGLGAFLVRGLLRRPELRRPFDRQVLRLPILGALARDIMAARLTRTLGTLLQNGVSLLAALRIVEGVIGNMAGRAALEQAGLQTREGRGLARSLAVSDVFPVRATHLMELGEETGQLADLCLRAAEIHEEAARTRLQRLVALLVPVITIVMGAIVAGIVSALLLAMLGLNDLAH